MSISEDDMRRLIELHDAGVISRKTLVEHAGLADLSDLVSDEDYPDMEDIDADDFLGRTYPLGSLIRPSGGSRFFSSGGTVNVSLANKPGGKPLVGHRRAPVYVEVDSKGYWTVVQHASGWTKIASACGQHSGWTFYVRDYFELVKEGEGK